jgi:hypothetical protein
MQELRGSRCKEQQRKKCAGWRNQSGLLGSCQRVSRGHYPSPSTRKFPLAIPTRQNLMVTTLRGGLSRPVPCPNPVLLELLPVLRPQGVTVHILCTESWFEIGDNLTANLRFARHPPSRLFAGCIKILFGAALLDQLAHEALLWLPKRISLRWYEGARGRRRL